MHYRKLKISDFDSVFNLPKAAFMADPTVVSSSVSCRVVYSHMMSKKFSQADRIASGLTVESTK